MKQVSLPIRGNWRQIFAAVLAATLASGLLLIHLRTLTPKLSTTEQITVSNSTHLSSLQTNPFYLPQKLLLWVALHIPHVDRVLAARLPSTLLAFITLALFIYICRRWYGIRSMVLGFLILVFSAWFLHIARFAGYDISFAAASMALIFLHVFYYDNAENWWASYIWIVASALLLYEPGFIWLILINIFWQRHDLAAGWQAIANWWQRAVAIIAVLVLWFALPAYTILHSPRLAQSWLGLPSIVPSWHSVAGRAVEVLGYFAYHGPHHPELWLGQLPLLNIFAIAMFLAGVFFYAKHWRAPRTGLLASCLVAGLMLPILNTTVSTSIVLPIIYIVAIGGIAFILHYWLSLFPHNELARAVGISILACAIAVACTYNFMQYFIAWPRNPETVAVYQLQQR